jgi:hypothetical protein
MWYRCFIRGENFPGQLAVSASPVGAAKAVTPLEPVGFYVTRFVEAANAEEAEHTALLLLRSDPKLAAPENYPASAQPRVFFEEVEEVAAEEIPHPQPGFSFYAMDSDSVE